MRPTRVTEDPHVTTFIRFALAIGLLSALISCRPSQASEPTAAPATDPGEARMWPDTPTTCGVCFAHSYQSRGTRGYGTRASERSIDRLDEIGTGAISLTPFGYQSLRGTSIRSSNNFPGGETTEAMRADIERAHEHGMVVMIKPHIWPAGGWRGELAPNPGEGGWEAWFESYTTFMMEWALLAESTGAEWLVVGVELKTATLTETDRWRALIAELRTVYSGHLTYAANWDEVSQVQFWDDLDAVSVQMFAPLADEGTPITRETVVEAANRWLNQFSRVAETVEKPLILTEAGVINRENALIRPYEWPNDRSEVATELGNTHQRWAYEAIAETFGAAENVIGIYWWKVFTDLNSNEEGEVGFVPLDKPAEQVLISICAPN